MAQDALRQLITDKLSQSDLRALCYDLQINYDEQLPDSVKSDKVVALLVICERKGLGSRLVTQCRKLYPDIVWPDWQKSTQGRTNALKSSFSSAAKTQPDKPTVAKDNGEQSGRESKQLLAQKFTPILGMCDFYLLKAIDDIALMTIKNDIKTLERIPIQYAKIEKMIPIRIKDKFIQIATKVEEQGAKIIPLLYSASRARQLNDMDAYYAKIQESRAYWKNLRNLFVSEFL